MSDRAESSDLPARPGLQDLIFRGCDDGWLRLPDGRLVRGPAIADSNQDLVNLLSHLAGTLRKREDNRPHSKEDS